MLYVMCSGRECVLESVTICTKIGNLQSNDFIECFILELLVDEVAVNSC